MIDEMLSGIKEFAARLDQIRERLDIERKYSELDILVERSSQDWNNVTLMLDIAELRNTLNLWETLNEDLEELQAFCEWEKTTGGFVTLEELQETYEDLDKRINETYVLTFFNGKYDTNNALLTIHAGAGGKEAQDWTLMLSEMYIRWAEKHKFKVKEISSTAGEDSTVLKNITLLISGKNAYGYLKHEVGVHRLVRISPFDAARRRHTSFAAVEVAPEIDKDTTIDIRPEDLRIDTYRSGGAGGQHVNKTESAIRITHIPTGIVVSCQTERSQHQNKDYAMKMLYSRLIAIKEQEHIDELSSITPERLSIEWGSQIRSYVFMPYQLVKDNRTSHQESNINKVMGGEIDEFILAHALIDNEKK